MVISTYLTPKCRVAMSIPPVIGFFLGLVVGVALSQILPYFPHIEPATATLFGAAIGSSIAVFSAVFVAERNRTSARHDLAALYLSILTPLGESAKEAAEYTRGSTTSGDEFIHFILIRIDNENPMPKLSKQLRRLDSLGKPDAILGTSSIALVVDAIFSIKEMATALEAAIALAERRTIDDIKSAGRLLHPLAIEASESIEKAVAALRRL